jgi:aliphatic sulfonates family ABC transporter substrate-binding protein
MWSQSPKLTAVIVVVCATMAGVAVLVTLTSVGAHRHRGSIRFAYQNRIGSAMCVVAVEKGFFTEEGVEVKPFRFNSGPACAEVLYSGSADIGTMGDTTALITVSRDNRFAIIASHGRGENRHRLVVRQDSLITTVEDLRGKTVGLKKGTSTYGGFLLFLASKQIDPSSIRIFDMKPSEMPDALAAGSIDAFVASEPTPSLAEVRGAREFATTGGLGNSYPILILAKSELLRERPQQVRQFLRAIRRAEDYIRDHPRETADILAEITGLSPEVVGQVMGRHVFSLSLDSAIVESLKKTADFLQEDGTIESTPDLQQAVDRRYLEEAGS